MGSNGNPKRQTWAHELFLIAITDNPGRGQVFVMIENNRARGPDFMLAETRPLSLRALALQSLRIRPLSHKFLKL